MKNLNKLIVLFLLCFTLFSCSDWTEIEADEIDKIGGSLPKSEQYYENLREWKVENKKEGRVSFGWFGGWTGKGAQLTSSLIGLPDSIDMVSIWGDATNLSPEQKIDLKTVQEGKGTKILMCLLVLDIGDRLTPSEHMGSDADRKAFWGWVDGDNEAIYSAIRKYANAICDTIDLYGYDGFDLDWEPNYAQPFDTNYELKPMDRIGTLIDELSKRLGPKSNTNKTLAVDGEPYALPAEYGENIDWFIIQSYDAYDVSGYSNSLNSRTERLINHYSGHLPPEDVTKKLIVTENFEKAAYHTTGGRKFRQEDGTYTWSYLGMAAWEPLINGKRYKKGGVGVYHIEYEYTAPDQTGFYPFTRQAIRIMNNLQYAPEYKEK